MTDQIYIRPTGFAVSPQSEEGDAVRLAGGMVYAHRFALILRRDGVVIERSRVAPGGIAAALGQLPDSVGAEAEAQWAALRFAHPALQLGERTVPLDHC
jgi:dihydropteroate synthase